MLTPLEYRILEISYKHGLSHLGSCISAVAILDDIYQMKKKDDIVILSAGHAGLSLYVVLEKYLGKDAEKLFLKHGVHPNYDKDDEIFCSTGSLGMGLSVATGYAIADRKRDVWCLISDGEASEGVVYESLNFARKYKLNNLRVYVNINGYSAYSKLENNGFKLASILNKIYRKIRNRFKGGSHIPFLNGQSAHYYKMNEKNWAWVQANKP